MTHLLSFHASPCVSLFQILVEQISVTRMSPKYAWLMLCRASAHEVLLLTVAGALVIQTVQLKLIDRNEGMKLLIFRCTIVLSAILDFQTRGLLQVLLTSMIHVLCILILSLNLVVQLAYTILVQQNMVCEVWWMCRLCWSFVGVLLVWLGAIVIC